MARVLIIDDDHHMSNMLIEMVRHAGYEASCAYTLQGGVAEALTGLYDVVFLDVNLPDGNGLEMLPKIREVSSAPEVIIVTGLGDPDAAELAIKSGAWDYVQKPVSLSELTLQLNRVFQYRDNISRLAKQAVTLRFDGVMGNSPQMRRCMDLVAQAANSMADVLVTGETGTGKELIARAIHYNSPRAKNSLVVVDCAALPESLVESALFGHEKGAFTGADKAKGGLIKQADKGTLFLDEVGELPPSVQKSFLRALQERCFRPIGAKQELRSDFRLIAATNRNLDSMVEEGLFRKDLLFRIRSISIALPSLRERPQDIKELMFHHVDRLCKNYDIETKGFSPDFLESLIAYEWPGNIRELVGTLDSAISVARREPILFPKHLPLSIRVQLARSHVQSLKSIPVMENVGDVLLHLGELPPYHDFRNSVLLEAESKYFKDLMDLTRGNIKTACQISGLGRTQLYTMLKRHGISRQNQ